MRATLFPLSWLVTFLAASAPGGAASIKLPCGSSAEAVRPLVPIVKASFCELSAGAGWEEGECARWSCVGDEDSSGECLDSTDRRYCFRYRSTSLNVSFRLACAGAPALDVKIACPRKNVLWDVLTKEQKALDEQVAGPGKAILTDALISQGFEIVPANGGFFGYDGTTKFQRVRR